MWLSNKGQVQGSSQRRDILFALLWGLVFLVALYLRMSGLFRGLGSQGSIFHPDEAKQVLALFNFLNGDYVRYYGSLFYDGYPYGLNHLDEYLLRPLLSFLSADIPDHFPLYYYARLLRVAYGMVTVVIAYRLIMSLVQNRSIALTGMFFLAIAPLSVTVTHFATGDIGIDLFSALCFLFLYYYSTGNRNSAWLFAAGVAVGAAFSAKYNGMLVGIVPGTLIFLQFLHKRDLWVFTVRSAVLIAGVVFGILCFTPNLILDLKPTLNNMLANFQFIKNYNVPADILAKSWPEKALLGLRNNSLYIISSLGYIVSLASFIGLLAAVKKYRDRQLPETVDDAGRLNLIISLALFPIAALFISLCGKYAVQPFHFSALLLPMILVACYLMSLLLRSPNKVFTGVSFILLILIILEFGRETVQENFFWRHEDNAYFEQNLPATLYDAEAFYTHRSGNIRSLFLEPAGSSVFRNRKTAAKGPDADLWNTIGVAPLPQVANPFGNDWIFLNGPSFPRNDKTLHIRGEDFGKTVQKYIVLPAGNEWPFIGIRSGSFPTEVTINLGGTLQTVQLDAHQQKIIYLEPKSWRISGNPDSSEKVFILPIKVSVPHDDIWLTFLADDREKNLFTLFGGGQEETPTIPQPIPERLMMQYHDALKRFRFLDLSLSWRVQDGKRIPMWEIAIPAGRYSLVAEVDGLVDDSEIAIELEDARGDLHRLPKESFAIHKGIQRIEYRFTKGFAPYQSRIVVTSISGKCQMLSFKLVPDYSKLSDDFKLWRAKGVPPEWAKRFNQ